MKVGLRPGDYATRSQVSLQQEFRLSTDQNCIVRLLKLERHICVFAAAAATLSECVQVFPSSQVCK